MPPETVTIRNDLVLDMRDDREHTDWTEELIQDVEAAIEEAPEPEPEAPVFELQQNTQIRELEELDTEYPRRIRVTNYHVHYTQNNRVHECKTDVMNAANTIRRLKVAQAAYQSIDSERDKQLLEDIFSDNMGRRAVRYIVTTGADIIESDDYDHWQNTVAHYKQAKEDFLSRKKEYAEQQAEYTQKAATIRQILRPIKSLNTQEIVEAVMGWENVWGVAVRIQRNAESSTLAIRIGLCDIFMEESAEISRYDEAQEIMLAPFYFTLKIYDNGRFNCPSTEYNTWGLSRERNPGGLGYDVHPHQLSDQPCFGTFGQALTDLANVGNIIPLIGGIIAFYSQYNSNDSAGISARYFHPAHIRGITNSAVYRTDMLSLMEEFASFKSINAGKLEQAIATYENYWDDMVRTSPPEIRPEHICYSCEEAEVADEYWVDTNGNRICETCWNDHYCHDCEYHVEDCTCEYD